MSVVLKFDFQKRKQLCSSEVKYLNYRKKRPNFACDNFLTFSLKQRETRTSSGPIPHPLTQPCANNKPPSKNV